MRSTSGKISGVRCPYCGREIDDSYVHSQVSKKLGSIKSPRKKKDPEQMSKLGKLGAEKRWGKKSKKTRKAKQF